jgi:hypothetical protein
MILWNLVNKNFHSWTLENLEFYIAMVNEFLWKKNVSEQRILRSKVEEGKTPVYWRHSRKEWEAVDEENLEIQ